MGKGILLLFLSPYKEAAMSSYTVESFNSDFTFSGSQTNDAPVQYLFYEALKNGDKIQKIVCIITEEVKISDRLEKFKSMMENYIQSNPELKKVYCDGKMQYETISYNEKEEETEKRAYQIYCGISQILKQKVNANVYIDYTGGFRDISFLMTAIIRYLEYHNITCKKIVYSNFQQKIIHSIDCIYDLFQLLNGVDQFVRTGNAKLLSECYEKETDRDTRELIQKLVEFSNIMSLCDIKKIDNILPQISHNLKIYKKKKKTHSLLSEIFEDFIDIIYEKLYINEEGLIDYPKLIHWCLDNNMIQQALTLYIEKMPKYYYEQKFLVLPEEVKLQLGHEDETTAFYVNLFEEGREDSFEQFMKVLKDVRECNDLTGELDRRKKELDEKGEKGINRIRNCLFQNYEKGIGEKKGFSMIGVPEQFFKDVPRNARSFYNTICNNQSLQWYFFDRQIQLSAKHGTYEKKVKALDYVREGQWKNTQSRISSQCLYEIMKYYLALKIMRNRINHASEADITEDEKIAIEQLEQVHGLCMNMEFDNVKLLLSQGLMAAELVSVC